jgi:hypothetical protein
MLLAGISGISRGQLRDALWESGMMIILTLILFFMVRKLRAERLYLLP